MSLMSYITSPFGYISLKGDLLSYISSSLDEDNANKLQELIYKHFISGDTVEHFCNKLFAQTLYFAVCKKALACIDWLLTKNFHPDAFEDIENKTVLHIAAKNGQLELLTTLLLKGANVNHRARNGGTALISCAKRGFSECLQVLINHGADCNLSNEFDESALIKASECGEVQCVRILLRSGADVNALDIKEETALMLTDDVECVKELLASGADVFKDTSYGTSVLISALESSDYDKVQCLLQYDTRVEEIGYKYKILAAALLGGDVFLDLVQQMIDEGATLDELPKETILGIALNCFWPSQLQCFKMLLPYLKHEDIPELMECAVKGHSLICLEILLKNGFELNICNRDNNIYLLHSAVEANAYTCFKFLLENKLDVNARDNNEQTPLFLIMNDDLGYCDEDFLKILLDCGADVNAKNKNQETVAMSRVDLLELSSLEIMYKAGLDIHAKDTQGRNLLHGLCAEKHFDSKHTIEVLRFLINHGVELNAQDHTGKTPLMFAAYYSNHKVMPLLLESGADVSFEDHGGISVLECSTKMHDGLYPLDLRCVEIVLSYMPISLQSHRCLVRSFDMLLLDKLPERHADYFELCFKLREKFPCIEQWCRANFANIVAMNGKDLVHFLMMNGIFPNVGDLKDVFLKSDASLKGIFKFLFINNVLSYTDVKGEENQTSVRSSDPTQHQGDLQSPSIQLIHDLQSQPWPLGKLSLHSVLSFDLSVCDLPPKLQRIVLHQNECLRLCPSQWDHIPIITDPIEYDQCPRPRPLLENWPVGHDLEICACKRCGPNGLKFCGVDVEITSTSRTNGFPPSRTNGFPTYSELPFQRELLIKEIARW